MKRSQFSDAQKAFIIRQGEDGTPVEEVCRKAGISPGDLLCLEEEIRRHDAFSNGADARVVGRERAPQADRVRPLARPGHAAGCHQAKALEACAQAQAGRRDDERMEGVATQGLPGSAARSDQLPLQVASPRAGHA